VGGENAVTVLNIFRQSLELYCTVRFLTTVHGIVGIKLEIETISMDFAYFLSFTILHF
jgi:hypothetical protein